MGTEQPQQNVPQERTLTLQEAEQIAQEITDKIAEQFGISASASRKRLFSECLVVLMGRFTVIP
jgi:hypothetical protein